MIRPIIEIVREMKDVFSEYELTKGELARTEELLEKIDNQKITISVIGQFKRGKSYLVNSILGDKILPIGIVPVTAVVTTIQYGDKAATVRFDNGIVKEVPFEELSSYINEQENNDNHLGVRQVEVYAPSDFLKDGVTFVDTPGVGSVHQKNTDEAYSFVKESDAVIFMLSVDSPINQIEIDFLKNAKDYAAKFYFVVNKIDTIDEEDLGQYLSYCRSLICKIMEVNDIQLFSVSAKTGQGIDELKYVIRRDCETIVRDIIEQSAKLKMKDIGQSALSQVMLYRRTLQMTHKAFDETFEELNKFFEILRNDAKEYVTQFSTNARMLDAGLNDIKNRLSDKVAELFGIEYYYNVVTVDLFRGGKNIDGGERDLTEEFLRAVEDTLEELNHTVSAIFMYREEDTYVVTQRIYDVNHLTRRLVKLRTELERTPQLDAQIEANKKPEFKIVNCE